MLIDYELIESVASSTTECQKIIFDTTPEVAEKMRFAFFWPTTNKTSNLHFDPALKAAGLLNSVTGHNAVENICSNILPLKTLKTLRLKTSIYVSLEQEDESFIARTIDFPIYAEGSDRIEAIDNLKDQLEELYYELMEDDDFSKEWLSYKSFFMKNIDD